MNLQAQPPEKKRRKTAKSSSSPPSFSLLPIEIIENCLARVPRSYYPKLSLVSKSFRSLLSSTDLYVARSRLGFTQKCLYVCLSGSASSDREWFQWITLSINPNLITKERTLGQLSVTIPSSNCATMAKPTVAGSEIYVIGGRNAPSSTVRVLDCCSHVWRDAPSMNVARYNPVSCFYEGKIYVMGGCGCLEQRSPFAEVFDTKTQSWESLPDPGVEISIYYFCDGIVEIEGKIHIRRGCTLYAYYDPKQGKWGKNKAMFTWSECVIDNLWYSFGHGSTDPYNLLWRDMNGGDIKEVKGLESFGNSYERHGGSESTMTKLATCGGKLYFMWEWYMKKYNTNRMVKICCAKISLEKREGGEIWGNVEWLDVVHTATTSCHLLHCLAISL